MNSATLRRAVRPKLTRDCRRMILEHLAERDGRHCHYCHRPFGPGLTGATLDHYVPLALWPTNKPRNLVLACEPCNNAKADHLPLLLALLLTGQDPASAGAGTPQLAGGPGVLLLMARLARDLRDCLRHTPVTPRVTGRERADLAGREAGL